MPRFVVKQPNGKLALFSTVVDNFTVVDSTEAEMLETLIEDDGSKRDSLEKIARGVNDEELRGGPAMILHYEPPFRRWQYALTHLSQEEKDELKALIPDCFERTPHV